MTFKIRFHTRFTKDKKNGRTRNLSRFTCHRRTLESIIREALGDKDAPPRGKSKMEKRRIRLRWERTSKKKGKGKLVKNVSRFSGKSYSSSFK